jgi:hypothetical protein
MNTTTLEVVKKKVNFLPNNEIKGWAKLTDGTKSNFVVTPSGEIELWGTNTHTELIHPIITGLLEMLYDDK